MHGMIDGFVTGAHHLGKSEEADAADEQTSHGGLIDLGPIRKRAEPGTQGGEQAGKEDGSKSADETQDSVGQQLAVVAQGDGGNSEQGLRAPEMAGDDDTGNGGEHDGAEDGGAPRANDFFNNKQNGGDGRVESSGQAGSRADRSEQAKAFAAEMQSTADQRSDAGADLQRWIFGSEGVAGTDGEGGGNEFSDHGANGNVAVVDVERGLGLIDAAAASLGEEVFDQEAEQQADQHGSKQQTILTRVRHGAEQPHAQPLDGHAEADDQQS